ncbi:MAG: hypothetical protein ACRBCS_15365 [Cellvibrionaceae bacterium]
MSENTDYLEMTFRSISCFADDGKLDVKELNMIMDIALRDGVVDENEKRVLSNIISKLTSKDLTPELSDRVTEIKQQINI